MKNKKRILWILLDILCAAAVMTVIWIVNYKLPGKGITAQNNLSFSAQAESQAASAKNLAGTLAVTSVKMDTADWKKKFADKFTSSTVVTKDSYTSPNLAVYLTRKQYDTGVTDKTEQGKHLKYGTKISYVLADVYVADIRCLQTAFAQNTYGIGYTQKLSDMADSLNAVLAVNGDSYSNNHNRYNGTVIRNGVIYRSQPTDSETCILNWDGTVKIVQPGETDLNTLIREGAYQSWVFGPSLLNDDGSAKTEFLTRDYIRESHPRTAIGYYEPGHYCFLLVDGRQKASRGMFLTEMSQLFASLGCRAAYNLDGGHCSFMYFYDGIANNPYKPEHKIYDGIFLRDISTAGGSAA